VKVLLFYPGNMGMGSTGSGIRARLIAEGLRYRGVNIHVVSSNIPKMFLSDGIGFTPLAASRSWGEPIREAAEEFKPDIFYGITEAGMDSLGKAARAMRRPVAYDLHGLRFVEEIQLDQSLGNKVLGVSRSFRWLSFAFSAAAITVANPTLQPILRRFHRRAYPVFGMTDVARFSPDGAAADLGSDPSRIQVLYAGNFVKWQGVELLLQSIRALSKEDNSFEFTLLGSIGKESETFKEWKNEFTGQPVHFLEYIDFERIPDYYRGADVLVIPRPSTLSTYLAFPQKLLDYMASGKTILATDIAPHRFALESPPAGILFPPTVKGLVEAFRQSIDEEVRQNLSGCARKMAVETYCHLRQTERIHTLFKEITGENTRGSETLE